MRAVLATLPPDNQRLFANPLPLPQDETTMTAAAVLGTNPLAAPAPKGLGGNQFLLTGVLLALVLIALALVFASVR